MSKVNEKYGVDDRLANVLSQHIFKPGWAESGIGCTCGRWPAITSSGRVNRDVGHLRHLAMEIHAAGFRHEGGEY